MCQCGQIKKLAFCGKDETCRLPFGGIGVPPANEWEYDELKWRVSMKGLSVVKGHEDYREVVYSFPDAAKGISGREKLYEQWLENAENVCRSVNSHIDLLKQHKRFE